MSMTVLLAWKDLRIEFRSKRRLSALFLFSLVLVLVGSFAYRWQEDVGFLPPLFWLVCVFTQLLFLGNSYNHETQNGCFDVLHVSPAKGYQLLGGKLLASLIWVLGVNTAVALEIAFFNSTTELIRPGLFILVLLESVGLLALGNLFFARLASGGSIGLDLFPLVATLSAPLLFLSMEISQASLRNLPLSDVGVHYLLLVLYDLFLVIACSSSYRLMVEE